MLHSVAQRLGKARAKGFDVVREAMGYEPVVTIHDDGTFTVSYERPQTNGERYWDESLHPEGQMYVEGFANPVRPQPDTDNLDKVAGIVESDWITRRRWATYMQQDTIQNALDTEGRQAEKIKQLMMAVLGGLGVTIVMIAIAMF